MDMDISREAGQVLISLSPLISQSLVPIEDWISTVSVLIDRCSDESPHQFEDEEHNIFTKDINSFDQETFLQLHSTIHSICMACTSPSHVRSLVDEGILGFRDGVLKAKILFDGVDRCRLWVLEALSHLASIGLGSDSPNESSRCLASLTNYVLDSTINEEKTQC
jgi:hypothetical protein